MLLLPLTCGSRIWQSRTGVVLLLVTLALVVRLGLLTGLCLVTGQTEFADDFRYYRFFMDHPLGLITGEGLQEIPEAVIYSPLVPLQVWFPGGWLRLWTGEFVAQRFSMMLYEVAALGITVWTMTLICGPNKWGTKHWIGAILLVLVPGSIAASTLWGQEDSISALWTSFALVALIRGRPSLSALFGGIGLYTHKLFALLLSLGIWSSCVGARWKIVLTTGAVTASFTTFLLLRWNLTGVSPASYEYNAIYNSPSPWALIERLTGPFGFQRLQYVVLGCTLLILGLVARRLLYKPVTPDAAVVAVHTTFFVTFLGVQPEHHQWCMPFMVYFAWRCWLRNDWLSFLLAWSYSAWAYGYKIAYGLQARASASEDGKIVFRQWTGGLSDFLPELQLVFHVMVLLIGIFLIWRSIHSSLTQVQE
ncbi:MAG: hypothetical protein KatS3mg104_0938 [Phycisphaerae bacterium]|nr:MAG: hypothetical protein KatS3mg104_0938 [Phycisphaerae bacterium]